MAVLSIGAFYFFRDTLVCLSRQNVISLTNLYSAVFSWSSIQTGFLFSIFGFVASKGDGFIGKIQSTSALRQFIIYTRGSIHIGFLLTFYSIPMSVLDIKLDKVGEVGTAVTALWWGLSIWAFFSFIRVAYMFGIILRPADKTLIPG